MERTKQRIAKVCVENTAYAFDKPFDYLVPTTLLDAAKEGCRVIVPFGRSNGKRQGMILSLEEADPETVKRIKPIAAVLDETPLLDREMRKMVFWLKERYFCTLFEAVHLLLPTGINWKLKLSYSLAKPLAELELSDYSETQRQILEYLHYQKKAVRSEKLCGDLGLAKTSKELEQLYKAGLLTRTSDAVRNIGDATAKMVRLVPEKPGQHRKKLTPRQMEVYQVLSAVGAASLKEICYFTGVTAAVVNTMVKNGIAEYYEQEIYRNPYQAVEQADAAAVTLSPEQQKAFDTLYDLYVTDKPAAALLYGVTGSGKTLVFLKLIDEAVARGQGVIVMVPEISLTPQTIGRFHKRYGRSVAVFHSGLSLAERMDEWKRVKKRRGEDRRGYPVSGVCTLPKHRFNHYGRGTRAHL